MALPEIIRVTSTASTQDLARELAIGSVVVTEHQSAGRGRLSRGWEAPPGTALLASFVVPLHPLTMLAAGVAAAEACGPQIRLKWPNDLMLGERKLAGILAEALPGRAVVGIGVNLTWAPPGAAMLAVDRDGLLERLRASLQAWLVATPEAVLERWRELSDTLGRAVRVELPSAIFEGIAEDVDADGCLLVSGRRFAAGDVIHLRPAAAPAPGGEGESPQTGP